MSFSLVKGLGFPAISQHLKIQGGLTIRCGYHSQKSRMHLFLSLLRTFINSENLSYGFRNNLLCTSFFFFVAQNLLMLLFQAHYFLSICLHVYLFLWRVHFSRMGRRLYLSCVPSAWHLVSDLQVSVNVCWVDCIFIEPLMIGDYVPLGSDVRNYWSGLADSSELEWDSLIDVSSSSNKVAKIKYRTLS